LKVLAESNGALDIGVVLVVRVNYPSA